MLKESSDMKKDKAVLTNEGGSLMFGNNHSQMAFRSKDLNAIWQKYFFVIVRDYARGFPLCGHPVQTSLESLTDYLLKNHF